MDKKQVAGILKLSEEDSRKLSYKEELVTTIQVVTSLPFVEGGEKSTVIDSELRVVEVEHPNFTALIDGEEFSFIVTDIVSPELEKSLKKIGEVTKTGDEVVEEETLEDEEKRLFQSRIPRVPVTAKEEVSKLFTGRIVFCDLCQEEHEDFILIERDGNTAEVLLSIECKDRRRFLDLPIEDVEATVERTLVTKYSYSEKEATKAALGERRYFG